MTRSSESRAFFAGLAVIALLTGALALCWTWSGLWVTPDSISYWQVSHEIRAGHGLRLLDGRSLRTWPPGYPWVLSLLPGEAGPSIRAIAVLHSILAAISTVFVGLNFRRFLRTSLPVESHVALSLVGTAVVSLMVSAPTTCFFLSENVFLPIVYATLLVLQYLASDDFRPRLPLMLLAACLIASAALTRFVGLALLVPMAVSLLISPGATWRWRLAAGAAAALIATIPPFVWLLRGTIAHVQPPRRFSTDLAIYANDFFAGLAREFFLTRHLWQFPGVAQCAACLAFGVLLWFWLSHRHGSPSSSGNPLVVFLITYPLLSLIMVSTLWHIDERFSGRYLYPIIMPILAIIASSALRLKSRWRSAVALAILVLCGLLPLLRAANNTRLVLQGKGYGSYPKLVGETFFKPSSIPSDTRDYAPVWP